MYLIVFKFADYFLFIMGREIRETLLNPFTPEISLVIPLLNVVQFLWFYFWEFVIGSTDNPLIDISLYSHHLSA